MDGGSVSDVIFYLLLGLGIGSLYAMLGAGIVIVYKGSGVINFAHGALAMYGMFTFDTAWNRGELFLPWVDIVPTHDLNLPVRITLDSDGSWPMVPSLILALVMAAVLGLGCHYLVFRPLRNASPLGKVVASLGVALYLQSVALLNFGTSFPQPKSIVPDEPIENFLGLGNTYPGNSLYAIGFAILVGAGLWALYHYSRFGLATRAAAGNEKGAILLGYSPQFLAAVNWVLASVLATATAIVVGPLQGPLTPVGLTALIVPALAAALVGSLRSIPIAIAGGLGLGAIRTLLEIRKTTWFDSGPLLWLQDGITQSVPLLVIVAVLFLRGRSLPIRGTVEERRLPTAPAPQRVGQHAFVGIVLVTMLAFFWQDSGSRTVFAGGLQTALGFMVIMLSMVVLTGYVGQISLAQMSMAGVAAFFMARMLADGTPKGSNLVPVSGPDFPWPIAALLGIAAAVIVGLVLALPALRIRGVQLAVVTIAAAIAIQSIYLENDELTQLRAGVPAFIDTPYFFGIDIGARSARAQNERPAFAIFSVIVVVLVAIAIANVRRTGTGRRFLAVRANERAAAAVGIDVSKTKLLAFGMSAAIAGIGGILIAFRQVEVSSANFPYAASLGVLAFAYLAGITSISGGIFAGLMVAGSLFAVGGNYFLADAGLEKYNVMIGAIGLIVTAIVHPEGIAPFFGALLRIMGNWLMRLIPGAATLRDAFRGPRGLEVRVILGALFVAFCWCLYNVTTPEPMLQRTLLFMFVAWLVVMGVAASGRYGEFAPSFPAAGAEVVSWGRRYGAVALTGYVLGWLIWPIRVDTYSKFWMPLLGAGIALFARALIMRIRGAGHGHDGHASGATPAFAGAGAAHPDDVQPGSTAETVPTVREEVTP